MNEITLSIIDIENFKLNLIEWLKNYNHFAILDSNNLSKYYPYYKDNYSFDLIACAGKQDIIKSFFSDSFKTFENIENSKKWWFGYIGYDCKNDIELLSSSNPDYIKFYDLYFFSPEIIFLLKNNKLILLSLKFQESELFQIIEDIKKIKYNRSDFNNRQYIIQQRIDSTQYYKKSLELINYIHKGYIYEINFCIEFFVDNYIDDPVNIFKKLKKFSPAPFSCLFRFNDLYIISASPERFLKKMKNVVISQPMKGTIKRGNSPQEDLKNRIYLKNSLKERAENIMAVDVVRNDLSKFNKTKKIQVVDLCGVYTFPVVHQMISTIEAEIENNASNVQLIKSLFPMASMTGAPKIEAMKLIDEFEESKRGIFSGSAGYIDPNGNFDFNVIIRSFIYNKNSKYLSFSAGSALTAMSNVYKEYEECLLKVIPLIKSINQEENVRKI